MTHLLLRLSRLLFGSSRKDGPSGFGLLAINGAVSTAKRVR